VYQFLGGCEQNNLFEWVDLVGEASAPQSGTSYVFHHLRWFTYGGRHGRFAMHFL